MIEVFIIVMVSAYCAYMLINMRRKFKADMMALDRTGEMLEALKLQYESRHGSIHESKENWRAYVQQFIAHLNMRKTNEMTQ